MSKEKKKPNVNGHDANKYEGQFVSGSASPRSGQQKSEKSYAGQAQAAIEAGNQPHNAKKEALGRNTRQG